MRVGYARVSTPEQNLDYQVEMLEKAGCKRVYSEKASGRDTKRKALQEMLDYVREGDEVCVCKLDRLGRSTKDLLSLVADFEERGISFISLQDGIDCNDSAIGKMMFHMMAAFAELERNLISERTKEGLESARRNGRRGGRPKGLSKEAKIKAAAAAELYKSNSISISEICRQLGVARSTLYSYLRHQGVKIK